MKLKIAVLEGDGIGPEIMKQGVAVLDAIAEKFGHEFIYHPAWRTNRCVGTDRYYLE